MRSICVQYPKGYWSMVFERAIKKMKEKHGLTPMPAETAYWLARLEIDKEIEESNAQLILEGVKRS